MSRAPRTGESAPDHPGALEHEPDIRASAITAVARTRAHGMHFYGQILGITLSPAAGGPGSPYLAPDRAVTPGPVPPVALAAVADLAMGSAVRAAVGPGRRLGTVSMTLHHIATVVRAPVVPEARVVWLDDEQRHALARVDCTDASGALVAAGQGWFMALPVPEGVQLRLLPWELDELPPVPPLAEGDLEPQERAAVEATVRAAERASARGTSVSEELTALTWDADPPEGMARGALRIGPELINRVGHLQGGALYGIGLAAAARAVGAGSVPLEPADGSWQFLRPGDGAELAVEATVTRSGRGAAFASVTLTVDGRAVGTGHFAFRPGPQA
ncbi:acyl-coenzyme A thioesterase PaaI-like protein [Blastococcus colisei]|uniref:Acyl-coenzyme A thioesterase PaaI-like protein n=1 Tax=Blastococcus colisei TaxID=1564162 RepID=A0A543P1R8_9ACTN|nr:acyl-CoA thioesterase domain-containing protein [Blastococcus colisei]TQN38008.1 acyl-coenzyme A thioesterase PaaI-like protein [Blastococcus colisei]